MTLNALFKAGDIPCLMSDHLAVTRYERYVTRKSSFISSNLVVAASGDDEVSNDLVLRRLFDRFSQATVTRRGLLTDTLANMRDLDPEFPCTVIGWFIEGRKRPVSFRWNSRSPVNPFVDRAQFVVGSGTDLSNFVVPPFVATPSRGQVENAASFCVERVATLWINEVVHGGMSRAKCGGGFDIYIYNPEVNQFCYLDNVGYLYFQLVRYHKYNGYLTYYIRHRADYMKDTYDAVLSTTGADTGYQLSTVTIGSPQHGRETAGTITEPIAPIAKMYACCFLAQDAHNGVILIDVSTALGKDAEKFMVSLDRGTDGTNRLAFDLPPSVISKMAAKATRLFQNRGLQLVKLVGHGFGRPVDT